MAKAARPIDRLLDIMARLRDPQGGCEWDLEQTFATIAPYTVEEAYEVADAIERNDLADLRDELGDLLFQVVFHSRMAQEQGAFAFDDVADAISEKMIRRHPHVFGDEARRTSAEQTRAWEVIKARAELGDVLFVVANIARTLDIDPEDALRATNAKFARRFRHIETALKARGKTPDQSDLAEMDALWDAAKAAEKARG